MEHYSFFGHRLLTLIWSLNTLTNIMIDFSWNWFKNNNAKYALVKKFHITMFSCSQNPSSAFSRTRMQLILLLEGVSGAS